MMMHPRRRRSLAALLSLAMAAGALVVTGGPDVSVASASSTGGPPACSVNNRLSDDYSSGLPSEVLDQGIPMTSDECLTSPNYEYQLLMTSNGDLVLSDALTGVQLWGSGTAGVGVYAEVMGDGTFGVYDRTGASIWTAPGTAGGGLDALFEQNDGNAVVTTAAGATLWSTNIQGSAPTPYLDAGQTLAANQELVTGDGAYALVMQTDGNLVLVANQVRNPGTGDDGTPIWWTGTDGSPGAYATMQTDGNLVVYSASGGDLWSSGTDGSAGNTVVMQTDGNLVIYDYVSTSSHSAVWQTYTNNIGRSVLGSGTPLRSGASLTSPDGKYELTMQSDGNLVEYYAALDTPIWASGTAGNPGAEAILVGGGSLLVVTDVTPPSYTTLWSSDTPGTTSTVLALQDDGNLVVYGSTGNAAWQTETYLYATNQLAGGQSLEPGAYLTSQSGQYKVVNSPGQGTAWIYQTSPNPACPLMAFPTYTQTTIDDQVNYYSQGVADSTLTLQSDGNLVMESPTNSVTWQSGSGGAAGSYSLVLQNDGNLVVYDDATGASTWSSGSATDRGSGLCGGTDLAQGQRLETPNGAYTLTMQSDCNLVLTQTSDDSVAWASDTDIDQSPWDTYGINYSDCSLAMQGDGNLVMYAGPDAPATSTVGANDPAMWSSGTQGNANALAALQEDGYLVMYGSNQLTVLTEFPTLSKFDQKLATDAGTTVAGSVVKLMIEGLLL